MAESYKVLGQAAPSLDTLTDLYTVPALTSAVAAMLSVAQIGDANDPAATYRLSVAIAGASDDPQQIILNEIQLAANVAQLIKLGLTLGPLDVVRVRCRDAACAFSLFGTEITA